MAEIRIPRRVREITADWLTDVLSAEGLLSGGCVADLDVARLSVGTGFTGRVLGLRPIYEPAAVAAVSSFALKVPTGAQSSASYEREGRFYQELAADTALRIPRCYWDAMNVETGDFALLLEDLSHLWVGDEHESCSPTEAEVIVRHLARMHAGWRFEPESLRSIAQSFVDEHSDLMPAHFDHTIERSLAALPGLAEPMLGVPQTLPHGDFRLGNMMFGDPGTAGELVVFDWQLTSVGPNRWGLCYLLALNLPVELRRDVEERLLRLCHTTLMECGVADYSFDRCREDYRLSLLLALLQPLGMERWRLLNDRRVEQLTGERRELLERSVLAFEQLQRAWTERSVAAIIDSDVGALLEGELHASHRRTSSS